MTSTKAAGRFVPGLGHPVHKQGDPRTPVLFRLAHEHDVFGPHLALFEAIGRAHPAVLGKTLPLNGAGVCGAVLADIDIPLGVTRGVALLARCAGLIGHLAEEMTDPIGHGHVHEHRPQHRLPTVTNRCLAPFVTAATGELHDHASRRAASAAPLGAHAHIAPRRRAGHPAIDADAANAPTSRLIPHTP